MIHSISCIKESIKPLPRVINDNPIKNKYDRISNPRELLIPDHGRSSDLLHLMTPFPFMQKTVAWVSSSDFVWSLQQRVCSGFTPDSLFTTRHESDGWHHNQWQRYILLLKLTFLQILFYPIHIRDVSGPYLLRTFSMQRYLWPKKVRLWYGASHISTHVHRPLSAKQYIYPRNHRAIWSKREAGKLSEPEVRTQYPAWKEIRKEPLHYCTKSH